MTYVYICRFCKRGKHYACEEFVDMPQGDPAPPGGGMCVCDHEAIYASPEEFWRKDERSNVA
jgi:hypothetical protein